MKGHLRQGLGPWTKHSCLRLEDGTLLTGAFSSRFEYLFNFDNTFEIHDDIEVLKRMGMAYGLESGSCSTEDLKMARSLVPKALEPYVTGQSALVTVVAEWPGVCPPLLRMAHGCSTKSKDGQGCEGLGDREGCGQQDGHLVGPPPVGICDQWSS